MFGCRGSGGAESALVARHRLNPKKTFLRVERIWELMGEVG
jgi:hypothetical protein